MTQLEEKELNRLTTERLLELYKSVRKHTEKIWARAGRGLDGIDHGAEIGPYEEHKQYYDKILNSNKDEYEKLDKYKRKIKEILDKRENI